MNKVIQTAITALATLAVGILVFRVASDEYRLHKFQEYRQLIANLNSDSVGAREGAVSGLSRYLNDKDFPDAFDFLIARIPRESDHNVLRGLATSVAQVKVTPEVQYTLTVALKEATDSLYGALASTGLKIFQQTHQIRGRVPKEERGALDLLNSYASEANSTVQGDLVKLPGKLVAASEIVAFVRDHCARDAIRDSDQRIVDLAKTFPSIKAADEQSIIAQDRLGVTTAIFAALHQNVPTGTCQTDHSSAASIAIQAADVTLRSGVVGGYQYDVRMVALPTSFAKGAQMTLSIQTKPPACVPELTDRSRTAIAYFSVEVSKNVTFKRSPQFTVYRPADYGPERTQYFIASYSPSESLDLVKLCKPSLRWRLKENGPARLVTKNGNSTLDFPMKSRVTSLYGAERAPTTYWFAVYR